jgi:hypothetical protein
MSCDNYKAPSTHSPTDPKYHFIPHFHPGDKYYYDISGDMHSRSDVKDKKIESSSHSDLGLTYEALTDSAGYVRLKISYDKLHIKIKNGDLEKDVTANKDASTSADPIEGVLGNILGTNLFITLDPQGNIVKVDGGKELSARILGAIDAPGVDTKTIIRQQMEGLVGEKFVRSTLQEVFKLFPDTAIYIGDSWKHNVETPEDVKLALDRRLTLESIKGNNAHVDDHTEFVKQDDASISIMGENVPAEIKGEQKGFYDVDTTSGMVLKAQSDLSLQGTLHVLNVEVPVKISTSKKISGKKI